MIIVSLEGLTTKATMQLTINQTLLFFVVFLFTTQAVDRLGQTYRLDPKSNSPSVKGE